MFLSRRTTLACITATAAALLLSGCGGDSDAGEKPAAHMNQAIHDSLPDRIKDAGVLKVGTEAFYPPHEYFDVDQETIIGIDPDIVDAIGDVMGVEIELQNLSWDGLLPALDAGRIDMVSAAMGVNEERVKKYDFVSYFNTIQGVTVLAENGDKFAEPNDLCGQNVAVLDGSHQLDILEDLNSGTCSESKMSIMPFSADSDALQQLKNGRADVHLAQYPAASYNARTFGGGKTFVAHPMEKLEPQILANAFRKDDSELRDAVLAATNELIESGSYAKILEEHGVGNSAVTKSEVNPLP